MSANALSASHSTEPTAAPILWASCDLCLRAYDAGESLRVTFKCGHRGQRRPNIRCEWCNNRQRQPIDCAACCIANKQPLNRLHVCPPSADLGSGTVIVDQ